MSDEGTTVEYTASVGIRLSPATQCRESDFEPDVWKALNETPWVQMDFVAATVKDDGTVAKMLDDTVRMMLSKSVLWLTGPDKLYMRVIHAESPDGYDHPFLEGDVDTKFRDAFLKHRMCMFETHLWVMDILSMKPTYQNFYLKMIHQNDPNGELIIRDSPFIRPEDPTDPNKKCLYLKLFPPVFGVSSLN